MCDIDRNSCTLLFNLYMQCHNMTFLVILLEDYTSSYLFSWYYDFTVDIDTRHKVFAWTKQNNLTLNPDKTTCTLFTPDPAEYKSNLDLK